ncbi:MAG: hypothetical protein ACTSUP_06355 [Candidatus Heimdallarchaeaceae archaeon]
MSERKHQARTAHAEKIFRNNEAKKKKKLNYDYFIGQIIFS